MCVVWVSACAGQPRTTALRSPRTRSFLKCTPQHARLFIERDAVHACIPLVYDVCGGHASRKKQQPTPPTKSPLPRLCKRAFSRSSRFFLCRFFTHREARATRDPHMCGTCVFSQQVGNHKRVNRGTPFPILHYDIQACEVERLILNMTERSASV